MTTKRKITRREIKEDHFMDAINASVEYVKTHRNMMLGILGGIIVVGLLIWGYTYYRTSRAEAALEAFGKANILFQRQQYQSAIKDFSDVAQTYSGTPSGGQATYYLAYCFFQIGQADSASYYYDRYLSDYSEKDFTYGAKTGLAACAEQKNDYTKAAELYWAQIDKYPDYFLTPHTLMSAARCYRLAGNLEKSREAYQRLIDKFPESSFLTEAKRRLAEVS